MDNLISISQPQDIPEKFRNTPIEKLLQYHNMDHPFDLYSEAQLLIGMCMDFRKQLKIPRNFAFIIRTAGANLENNAFQVSFAISVGGVRHIALIAHNDCGMSGLSSRKHQFVDGLVQHAGWERSKAEDQFETFAPSSEIGDEIAFISKQALLLRAQYPTIMIVPMLYKVGDHRLYLVNEVE